VTVDGNALSPRQPVNAVPVAQYAMTGPDSPSSTASAASATQFQNDRLYAGVSVNGENLTMVMIAKPAFSPAGTSTVSGYSKAVDVYSLTSALAIPVTISSTGSSIGRASAPDVRVLARIDPAYTGLVGKLTAGTSYTGLQIDVLSSTGAVTKSYCYGTVFVSGVQPMPQPGVYEITLAPVQFHHRVANPSSPGTFVEAGWNFVNNTVPAATSCVQ
jgi:Type VI secretion system effector, Hcp